MRSVRSRLICLLLVMVLLPLCLQEVTLTARADFENTYVNTGDQRADLIGVALTQVGYREGSNNYTKYGEWYGAPNTAWCGMFVSWCANQAGIPTSVLKKNGFASASSFNIPSFYASQKLPRPGDLFFKTNGSHTGIVYYIEGDYFYTLEGNTDENSDDGVGVFIRKRYLYDAYYFGEPPYQSDMGHNYAKDIEQEHPHKEYYKCTDCDNMYYTGNRGSISTCQQCIMENCDHKYGNWTTEDGEYHRGVCSLCTKEELFGHTWGSGRLTKIPTCEDTGLKWQNCDKCGATREVEVPATNDHQYGDWIFIDNDYHYRTCQTCGRERTERHSTGQWESDLFEHWYICSGCGGRAGMEAHEIAGGCDTACSVCEYISPVGHLYAEEWVYNNSGHWRECENCSDNAYYGDHTFSAGCDETCDTCGYTRQREHNYAEHWGNNEKGHWHACQDCGKIQELFEHIAGPAATEKTAQTCTACGYELVAVRSHVHSVTYESDPNTHWGRCDCGYRIAQEGHLWDLGTESCKVCQVRLPEVETTEIPWLIILPAVAGAAALTAIILGVVLAAKKARKKKLVAV